MVNSVLEERLIQTFRQLDGDQQQRVVDFASQLQTPLPPGTPGEALAALAREIDFPRDDLAEIVAAIEEDCERIDWGGWE